MDTAWGVSMVSSVPMFQTENQHGVLGGEELLDFWNGAANLLFRVGEIFGGNFEVPSVLSVV